MSFLIERFRKLVRDKLSKRYAAGQIAFFELEPLDTSTRIMVQRNPDGGQPVCMQVDLPDVYIARSNTSPYALSTEECDRLVKSLDLAMEKR
ncbi:MAG: hypothetical protein OEM51_01690 [Gammaproteobacteria bacterium]|nr:hypothetical protein [Gammaproteobacteria bacterium]